MLSNYFGKIQVLRDKLGEVWRIQIQVYPQTSIEPKYGDFNLKNKVSAHGLVYEKHQIDNENMLVKSKIVQQW